MQFIPHLGEVGVFLQGYDKREVKEILLSDRFEIDVEIDEEDARFSGLYTTPCYIVETPIDQLTIPGAFEKEDFKIALTDMISGEIKNKTFL